MLSVLDSSELFQFFFKKMVEQRNGSADENDRKDGSDADTVELSGKDHADGDGNHQIDDVDAVLREADALVNTVGDGLHDAVTGIWNDAHIERHCGTDTGEEQRQKQQRKANDEHPRRHVTIRKAGQQVRKDVQEAGKDDAERNLQKIHHKNEALIDPYGMGQRLMCSFCILFFTVCMENQLHKDEQGIERQCRISEIVSCNNGDTIRNRDNR